MAVKTDDAGAEKARHDLITRLKRVEGQVRGVQKLIEEGHDCEAVAQQMSAARKALDKAFFEMIACAIEHPQFSPNTRETREARITRVSRALAKFA